MRFRIHRGASEIGGNCIEVESGAGRVLLDLGMPLQGEPTSPAVTGLTERDDSLLGVILSHPHLDHYGLLPQARADLPVWLGAGAQRLLEAAAPFAPGAALPQTIAAYRDRQRFEVGLFKVTPYLMDHSAFDAHALLIEADGRRLFYTGDFRGHGRKVGVFERFIAEPPTDVDVLLMEGTTVTRTDADGSEQEVEAKALQLMDEHAGLVLLNFSAQNIDRFVTFLRAAMRAGRTFVIDAYMACLLQALQMKGLPDVAAHPNLRVYLPRSQKRMIVRDQRFELIEPFRGRRIFGEEIAASPGRFAMMFRSSMITDLAAVDLAGAALIYSLWPGYLERDRIDLRAWAAERGVGFHIVHCSGHAYPKDLQRMARALNPKRLVPIHTERPEAFRTLHTRVEIIENGVWAEL
jgi:ribonuclease J